MILSGQSIRKRGIFNPFCERTLYNGMTHGLGPAGYDVRIDQKVILEPGGFSLASTLEHFTMPNDLLAFVHDKSTWARLGLALQNTVIEPGWSGWLTLELTNHGPETLVIEDGMAIGQIVFHLLDEPAEPYRGKYHQQARGPQPAITNASDYSALVLPSGASGV